MHFALKWTSFVGLWTVNINFWRRGMRTRYSGRKQSPTGHASQVPPVFHRKSENAVLYWTNVGLSWIKLQFLFCKTHKTEFVVQLFSLPLCRQCLVIATQVLYPSAYYGGRNVLPTLMFVVPCGRRGIRTFVTMMELLHRIPRWNTSHAVRPVSV